MRGDDFWPHLEMFTNRSDLVPVILNNRTMNGEMRSQVGLMPMVIKFRPSDKGTLCEQFCDMWQLEVILEKKVKLRVNCGQR